MYALLLLAHALSGGLALAGAAGAIGSRLFGWAHRVHVVAGRLFTAGMLGVALTGLGITAVNPNLFLLAIAVFLLYLTVMGWRYAKARQGLGSALDKVLAVIFVALFVAMVGYGAWHVSAGRGMGWVLVVFGGIGLLQSGGDLRGVFGTPVTGRLRIVAHLSRMLGGTIGVITAFLLVQLQSNSIVVWLGPTALLTPLIFYWSARIRGGWLPKRAPERIEA